MPRDTHAADNEIQKKHASPILNELKRKLLAIQAEKSTLPKSSLGKAVSYALKEYPRCRIIYLRRNTS